jgi:hypothetical protein
VHLKSAKSKLVLQFKNDQATTASLFFVYYGFHCGFYQLPNLIKFSLTKTTPVDSSDDVCPSHAAAVAKHLTSHKSNSAKDRHATDKNVIRKR